MAFAKALESLPSEWLAFLQKNELDSPIVLANLLPGDVPEFETAPPCIQRLIDLAGGLEFRDNRRLETAPVVSHTPAKRPTADKPVVHSLAKRPLKLPKKSPGISPDSLSKSRRK